MMITLEIHTIQMNEIDKVRHIEHDDRMESMIIKQQLKRLF